MEKTKLPSELSEIEKMEKREMDEIKGAIKPFVEKTVEYITEDSKIMGIEYKIKIFMDALNQIQEYKRKASQETKILNIYDVHRCITSIWESEWRRTAATIETYRTILTRINDIN